MSTTTLLPQVRVATYDLKKNHDHCAADMAQAMRFVERVGTKCYNLYRIEKVNGTWRTDWEVAN